MAKSFAIFGLLFICGFATGEFALPDLSQYDVCSTEGDFCLPLNQCPFFTSDDFKKEDKPPLCGYNGSEPIVCCTTDLSSVLMHKNNLRTVSGQKCAQYEKTICSRDGVKVDENDEDHLKRIEYMVMLGYRKDVNRMTWDCSGTLISRRYVLSSASCATLNGLNPIYARLGHGAKSLTAKITLIFVHPDYKYPAVDNDIALYRLNQTVDLHDEIEPACLHQYTSILTTNHLLTRKWTTRTASEVSKAPEDSIMLDLFVFEECENAFNNSYLPTGFHKQGMICAGQKSRSNNNSCLSELGGPVTLPPNEKLLESECFLIRMAGLWTRAFKCSGSASIGVFTNVAHYIPWIESIVWPNNATDSLQVWQ
uniref:Serine protease snake-6 n=1 Tax=Sogatella furcifera TaxID=113103 RepID=A0A1S6J0X5_SOGFU|nr:serine protease snake-6 [Sogatella furcifera]